MILQPFAKKSVPRFAPLRFNLSAAEMAKIALGLLETQGGFTLGVHGNPVTYDLWAVSVDGYEKKFLGCPSLCEIEQYLLKYPIYGTGDYFGGWIDRNGPMQKCHLDHSRLYSQKHTAIMEARKQKQKAIFNLSTQETIVLEGPCVPPSGGDEPPLTLHGIPIVSVPNLDSEINQ